MEFTTYGNVPARLSAVKGGRMIVQPDFPEHWKTRLLVSLTHDESAPMAVIRLWAHCQMSHRSYFPDMTPAQLASICHWGDRKPSCHAALIKAGFVSRLSPRGFTAHQWNEHNAQLLQKWAAGAKGGRPPGENSDQNVKNPEISLMTEISDGQKKPNKTGESEKPTDNRPTTGPVPDRSDPIRSDRSDGVDQIDPIRSDRPNEPADGPDFKNASGGNGSDLTEAELEACKHYHADLSTPAGALVKQIFQHASAVGIPTLEEAISFAKSKVKTDEAPLADDWARAWFTSMNDQGWHDKKHEPISDWRKHLQGYVMSCWRNQRGVSAPPPPKRYTPNI